MKLQDGDSLSIWKDTVSMPGCPALTSDLNVDVCVVGAGLGGLTSAYLLQLEGKKVCVLEKLEIGGGQTGRTTAHFVTALDDRYFELEKYHGTEGVKLAAGSHRAAVDKVIEIVNKEKIECDLKKVTGYLFRSPDSPSDILERELDASRRAGLKTELTSTTAENSFLKGKALAFPEQVQLHPLKYLKALAEIFISRGGQIFTQTHVAEISGGKNAYVKTRDKRTVHAQSIIVATNTPINDLVAIHTKQAAYRTYVVGFKIPKGSVAEALYWDTTDPYHYVRLQGDDVLIVGGEDHKTGQSDDPEDSFVKLEEWTRKVLPQAGDVIYRWSGQVMEPVDGLGFIGHNPLDKKNVYIITGDSGNGMTHCTLGGLIITDQIMGRQNKWETLYNPSRISLWATGEFMKETLNVVAQYADWVLPQQSPEELVKLAAGEGIVVREGMKLIATSKDENGNIERVSAVCTHLGGVVRWNTVEKTWDCPCHGSRFDRKGSVVEGPANTDLARVDDSNSASANSARRSAEEKR